MGEAKRRGRYEVRQAEAIERNRLAAQIAEEERLRKEILLRREGLPQQSSKRLSQKSLMMAAIIGSFG